MDVKKVFSLLFLCTWLLKIKLESLKIVQLFLQPEGSHASDCIINIREPRGLLTEREQRVLSFSFCAQREVSRKQSSFHSVGMHYMLYNYSTFCSEEV